MRYLFFDIECSNEINICEFGYIITDEKFNILRREDITINPEAPFTLTGRAHRKDLVLAHSEDTYYNSKIFSEFYEKIKNLLEESDQIVAGHAVHNDATFLRTACKKYKLPFINFDFVDTQCIYEECKSIKSVSLEKAGEDSGSENVQHVHQSDYDAIITMEIVKNLCDQMNCSFEELIKFCPTCTGYSKNGNIKCKAKQIKQNEEYEKLKKGELKIGKKRYCEIMDRYVQNLDNTTKKNNSKISGKLFCFDLDYELNHYKEMFVIINRLIFLGAQYTRKSSECDIYVSYETQQDESHHNCTRLDSVKQANLGGANIEIITIDELLDRIKLTKEKISTTKFPSKNFLYKNITKVNSKKVNDSDNKRYSSTQTQMTIGDCISAKGINNLKDYFNN